MLRRVCVLLHLSHFHDVARISVIPCLLCLLFRVAYIPCLLQDELEAELKELMKKSTTQLPSAPTEEPVAAQPGLVPFLSFSSVHSTEQTEVSYTTKTQNRPP